MKIIITTKDWADEFDYPIISLITDELEEEFWKRMKELKKTGVNFSLKRSYYFGTNEAFNFSYNNIIDMVKEAQTITDEEMNVLKKFNVFDLGINIVQRALDNDEFEEDEAYDDDY